MVQEQWASIQTFFESTHFGSVQHRRGAELEDLLRRRLRVERPGREEGPGLRPLAAHVDPNKRVDPVDLMYRWTRDSRDTSIPQDALLALLSSAQTLLREEAGPLLELRLPEGGRDPKMVIVGDTHGQLLDVLHIFHTHGLPSESCVYLFNGDIADRGPQAVEILILVLAFKLRFPRHVHFLRGNHENREINERPKDLGGGFLQECLEKYGEQAYEMFEGVFASLPLFAVVQDEIFVVHAGLFRTPEVTLDRLRGLSCWQEHYPMFNGRPASTWSAEHAILFDAQWGDPHPQEGFRPSRRGPGVLDFGRDVTEDFLDRNGLSLVVRSHECPRSGRGFAYAHGRRLLTVFSASNYGGVMGNRGAVAVLRPRTAAVLTAVASEKPQLFGDVSLQVLEHDISVSSPESGSTVFRQASLARRVSGDCPLLQPALAILLFNREALRARCREVDPEGTGMVAKAFLLDELAAISCKIDWQRILNDCLGMGRDLDYEGFLDAVRVRWMYSTAEQIARLATVMLRGELTTEDITALLAMSSEPAEGGEHCAITGIRRAAKLISPEITQWQLEDLLTSLGGGAGGARPQDFVARLMLFAPPLPDPPEAWMRGALSRLGTPLRAWANTSDVCHAACQFYRAHAPEGAALLSVSAVAKAFEAVLLAASPSELAGLGPVLSGGGGVDLARLEGLVRAADSSGSGSISFLELARALLPGHDAIGEPSRHCPPMLLAAVAAHSERNTGVEEFVFSYRGALLRGCRFVDTHGSGLLEPDVFVRVAAALAEVVGRPLTPRQAERLRVVLGTRLVPYALALSRFETVLEREVNAGLN